MSIGLTKRQDDALRFLCAYHAEHGKYPALREICEGIDVGNPSAAHRLLLCLEERGYIRRLHSRPRAIEVLIKPKHSAPITADALSPQLQVRLYAFCRRHGEDPMAVLADALVLHMDAIDSEKQLGVVQ